MDLYCKTCGTVNDYRTEKKSNNLVATCNSCGVFIKNIPYSKPALYFGKYKNIPIEDYNTPEMVNYLHWIRNHDNIWPKTSDRIKQAINLRLDGKI